MDTIEIGVDDLNICYEEGYLIARVPSETFSMDALAEYFKPFPESQSMYGTSMNVQLTGREVLAKYRRHVDRKAKAPADWYEAMHMVNELDEVIRL